MSYSTIIQLDNLEDLAFLELPLYPDTYYSYTISLEQNTYELEFLWTSFNENWNFSLNHENGEPILTNHALTPALAIDIPVHVGLEGFFYLEPIAQNSSAKWSDLKYNLSDNYKLLFITKVDLL